MKLSNWITLFILINLVLFHPYSSSNADELVWGENVGPVFAYVDQIDHAKGLTIRAAPSPESQSLGYIPSGTKIRGHNEFKGGWVKLRSPVGNGWVNLGFLKPYSFEGTVIKVDNTELCLPVRAGPAASHEKVGCAQIGEGLNLTGIMTADNWWQLTDRRGWVDASSVQLPIEPPQTVGANAETPGVTSVGPAGSPSREKPITTPPQLGSSTQTGSVSEKAPSGPPMTSSPSGQIAAPPPMAAQGNEELPPIVCAGGWCVNYSNSQVTHNGKVVSGIECFKNDICANIVAQHHVAKATTDGIATFGNFRLLTNGVILDSESGKLLINCNDKGSPDYKCVANFLRKTVADISGESKNGSISVQGDASKEKIKKKTDKTSESRKQSSTKSSSGSANVQKRASNAPSSAKDEQHEREMKMNEGAWDNARGMGL